MQATVLTFDIHRDPVTDLALDLDLQDRLLAAVGHETPDRRALVAEAVNDAVTRQLSVCGWDGDWSAADLVTAVLDVADEIDVIEQAIGDLETQPCRRCGATVPITRVEGSVQQTDGSGDISCDSCAEAAGLDATPTQLTFSHRMREGHEYDHGEEQGTLIQVVAGIDDFARPVPTRLVIDRSYLLPADPEDDGVRYRRCFEAADGYIRAWLRLHGIDPTSDAGTGWELTVNRADWR